MDEASALEGEIGLLRRCKQCRGRQHILVVIHDDAARTRRAQGSRQADGRRQRLPERRGEAVAFFVFGVLGDYRQILLSLAQKARDWTGGDDGLAGFVMGPLLGRFEFDLEGQVASYYALAVLGFWFKWVMREAGLPTTDDNNRPRTLYCLRHTSIMFRLLYGQGIDMLTLARNARTSVQMIERFYASSLDGEMNVAMLQSRRTSKSKSKSTS